MTTHVISTKNVWSVSGTGKKGMEIQLPTAMSAIQAAEYATSRDFSRSPNIVNH